MRARPASATPPFGVSAPGCLPRVGSAGIVAPHSASRGRHASLWGQLPTFSPCCCATAASAWGGHGEGKASAGDTDTGTASGGVT